MNVAQLAPPPQPGLQRVSTDATEKDADFLALRLLNKRSRLRLSPQPIQLDPLPSKGRLFAIANSQGWFAAAVSNADGSSALVFSTLPELRAALVSSSSTEPPNAFKPRLSTPLSGVPHIVVFTQDDSRLLVAFTDGSISVFDSHTIFNGAPPSSLHTFRSASGKALRDLLPCTGDAHHVAVLRELGDGLTVELLDVHAMSSVGGWNAGGTPDTNPVSLSWSPKGKQIAIGLESGDIVTYSPSDTSSLKSVVPRPPSAGQQSIISVTWLSNTEFHAIYAPAGPLSPDSEQSHYILYLDPKANIAGDVKLTSPYMPFPGLRPPGAYMVPLRQWEPSRLLLFVGDSTSSDVGLIGSLSGSSTQLDSWCNLMLEETSTPSVPLDSDMNETVPLGLELDLTATQPFSYTGPSGEATDVPPPPDMYLYANDGTVTAWHVIQTEGVAYPGMGVTPVVSVASSPVVVPSQTNAITTSPNAFGAPAPPAQSTFGSSPPTTSAAPSSGGAFGFSAFSGAPSAFGNTSFGFGTQKPSTSLSPPSAPALSTPSISVEMASATDDSMAPEASGFSGMSLGLGGEPKSNANANAMFGSLGNTPQPSANPPFGSSPSTSSAFGSFGAGAIKPATGFGAFSGNGPSTFGSSGGFGGGAFSSGGGAFSGGAFSGSSAFGAKPSTDGGAGRPEADTKPASGFGQTGFTAAASQPAFGQSAFGQSSFGQSSFGQSSFSAAPKPAATSAFGSSGGGFAAFASAAPTSFASAAQKPADGKPVWSTTPAQDSKSQEATTSTTSAFGSSPTAPSASSGGAFGGLAQASQGNVFGKSAFGQSSFGQSSFAQPTTASSGIKPATGAFGGGGGGFSSFASGGPSAFAAAAQQSSASDGKPAWASSAVGKPTPSEQPSSAFASTSSAAGSSAFGSSSQALGASTASPAASPEKPPVVATPPATPPLKSPAAEQKTPAPTTTPAVPPPTGGAFAGLTTSSTGFSKLQPGFGAFGSTTTPSSSPFFQKPSTSTTPQTSVFGQSSFGATTTPTPTPPSKDGASGPTFGSSSFGQPSIFGKSTFGSPSPFKPPASNTTPTSSPTTTTLKSAFSAFSGSSSPFGSAAAGSSGKSFGDLLRQKDGEGGETGKASSEARPQGFSRTAEEWKKPVSAFAALKDRTTKTPEKGKEIDDDDGEADDDEGDRSFRDDDGSDDEDDGIDAFLKSDEEDLGTDEEEEEEEDTAAPPAARTPPESPTVKQVPKTPAPIFGGSIFGPPTPTPSKEEGKSPTVADRARSTTPPGSPADSTEPPPATKVFAPPLDRATSAPPTSTPTPGLLGVGRPSTRPARSSPLASRPISGTDEEENEDDEDDRAPSPSALKKARSASPAIPAPASSIARPKTPPTLFGVVPAPPKPTPFTLTPSPTPSSSTKSTPSVVDKSTEAPKPAATPAKPPLTGPGVSATPGGLFDKIPPPVFTPPPLPAGGLFGQKPSAPPTGGLFGQPSSATTSGGLFGQKPPLPPTSQPSTSRPSVSTPAVSAGGLFPGSLPPAPVTSPSPASGSFGFPALAGKPSLFGSAASPPSTGIGSLILAKPKVPVPTPAQDMQTEFLVLYNGLARELEELKVLATRTASRTVELGKTSSGLKATRDLTDKSKWVLGDLPQFKHIMKEVEGEVQKWQESKAALVSYLRELESDMLKASTRMEEIDRFSHATTDADFAQMLKSRLLNPEHLETRTQLRRDIRTMRGRIQQLEDYIQLSKKRLNSMKSGKPTFKPPSLDTINRTYQNIDIAIEQDHLDVRSLTDRVATLELGSKLPRATPRDKRLPDRASRRVGREVTPDIAASTAATLNAERSAQKLKRALLSSIPRLNTDAVDATPPLKQEQKRRAPLLAPDSGLGIGAAFAAGLTTGTGPSSPWVLPPPESEPAQAWTMPPFVLDAAGSPLSGLGASRTRPGREKQHAKPIQLGQKPPPPPPPAGFSWGPVPTIQPKTTIPIFTDLSRNRKGKGKAEDGGGLGDSWVAEGFGDSAK